jgi:hypothetical protein
VQGKRVWGTGYRVQGTGVYRARGAGAVGVQGIGYRIQGTGCRVQGTRYRGAEVRGTVVEGTRVHRVQGAGYSSTVGRDTLLMIL